MIGGRLELDCTGESQGTKHEPSFATLASDRRVDERLAIAALIKTYSRDEVIPVLRSILADLRQEVQSGARDALPDFDSAAFSADIALQIEARRKPRLLSVINATGILIHTNLGRARLAPEALAAIDAAGRDHSNLEFDLGSGKRGSRHAHVEDLICELTGAEAALVVNNCAGAVLLSLMATAHGRKVVASRGELIEIGGAFRLPDIIEQSGARLKEVGATNKTRIGDYADAIDTETAVLLKSHTSNYQIVGFTAAPAREALADLARATQTIFMEDLGSGVLIDLSPFGLKNEPIVSDVIRSGADLVMFSGDKLLGGPQCGIIAGRADVVRSLKAHPLCRAVRIDKLSLAALEATLRLYRAPNNPLEKVPVLRAIAESDETVRRRAQRLAGLLKALGLDEVESAPSEAYVGGGSLPQQSLSSHAVSVKGARHSPDAIAQALRTVARPVIGRIRENRFCLDLRTVTDDELRDIVAGFRAVLAS